MELTFSKKPEYNPFWEHPPLHLIREDIVMKKANPIFILFFLSLSLLAEDKPNYFILNCKGEGDAHHSCDPFGIDKDRREITLAFSGDSGIFKDIIADAGCYPVQFPLSGKILDVVQNEENITFKLNYDGSYNQSNSMQGTFNKNTESLTLEKIDSDDTGNVLELYCSDFN